MEAHGATVRETVKADKQKYPGQKAVDLALEYPKVVVARGKKVLEFKVRDGKLTGDLGLEDLRKALLGPSGNLRAPTLRVGKTLYVGFNEEMYEALLG